MIASLLSTKELFQTKLVDEKGSKIDAVIRLSLNHVFS